MDEIVIGGKNIQSNINEKQNPAIKQQGFINKEPFVLKNIKKRDLLVCCHYCRVPGTDKVKSCVFVQKRAG